MKTWLRPEQDNAVLREYRHALETGAHVLAIKIFVANKDLKDRLVRVRNSVFATREVRHA